MDDKYKCSCHLKSGGSVVEAAAQLEYVLFKASTKLGLCLRMSTLAVARIVGAQLGQVNLADREAIAAEITAQIALGRADAEKMIAELRGQHVDH